MSNGINTVNVDIKLGANKYFVDEDNRHVILKDKPDPKEFKKLMNACPAGLYKLGEDNIASFDYAGCLECGACRILCAETILDKWEYPRGTFGVEFRGG